MTRQLHRIHIDITLQAPWLVHGNDPGRLGLDAVALRDHLERPILPGTLLVGRIAAAWLELKRDFGLGSLPDPKAWFGAEAQNYEPDHARLLVEDLLCQTAEAQRTETAFSVNRIRQSEETGAVEPGMLLLAEGPHDPGQSVAFQGVWRAWLESAEVKPLAQALRAGLLWQTQIGALDTVGLGVLVAAKVDIVAVDRTAVLPCGDRGSGRKRLILRFAGPLCVGVRGDSGNLFESSDVIPGGTIKAALASMLVQREGARGPASACNTALARAFDGLRITHAMPAADPTRRPGQLPLSLVATSADPLAFHDAALSAVEFLPGGRAPLFQIDWKGKQWHAAAGTQGWGRTDRHLRVRTAIDADEHVAKEGNLFAYECRAATNGSQTAWLADIDLPDGVTADAVWNELAQLLAQGLGPVGKTGAWAAVEMSDDLSEVWPCDALAQLPSPIILQLQSPALLLAADDLADQLAPDLEALYRQAFHDLSGGALALQRFFASQSLCGGTYLWGRHGRRHGASRYRPYVLSDPGSVFVLRAEAEREADALAVLRVWRRRGLALPPQVQKAYGVAWRINPFGPENGWGEVTVNPRHDLCRTLATEEQP